MPKFASAKPQKTSTQLKFVQQKSEADERAREDPEEGEKRRDFKRAKETADLICKSKKLRSIYEKIPENPWTKRYNYYFKHGETMYSRKAFRKRGEDCGDRPRMTEERLLNEVAAIITLACAYLYGNGTPKSTKDAVFLLEMAAGGEYNMPMANCMLEQIYFHGQSSGSFRDSTNHEEDPYFWPAADWHPYPGIPHIMRANYPGVQVLFESKSYRQK